MPDLNTTFQLAPHARFRRFAEEGVVINQSAAESLVLNDVAARIVELAAKPRTVASCVESLAQEFDAPRETIEQDVLSFVGELLTDGVLVEVSS